MNKWDLSRRHFLRDMGFGLGLLPLFGAERARGAVCPRRLILVVQTEGTIQPSFWPSGGDGRALSTMSFPEITKPLEPHKADIMMLGGVAMQNFTDYPNHGGGHENYSLMFTGAKGNPSAYKDPRWEPWEAAGPTIDHHIATRLKDGPAVEALRLGVQIERQGSYQAQKRAFYRADRQPHSPEDSPYKVFDALFAGKAAGGAALDGIRAENRSLLDFVAKDLERFAGRLGKDYQDQVGAHLASVRDLEKQLTPSAGGGVACDPKRPTQIDVNANANYPAVMEMQFDLAVAALRCDVTRVVGIQLNNANGEKVVYNWVSGVNQQAMEYGQRDYHDLAHRPGANNRDKILVDQWYMSRLAGLIARLKTADCGGTLLDNTALLWANHMGNGGAHSSTGLPWVLAGSCGGYFKPGRFVPINGPTNGVFVALANAMGVPTQTFGDAKYGGEAVALRA